MIQKMVGFGPGDLPPMLDVEATGGQSPATITAKIHTWVDKIKAATGRTPMIYTGKYFWDPNVQTTDFASFPLVLAAYVKPNCPNTPNAWNKWTMWQYNSNGSIPGITGNVDVDEFNGTLEDLKKLAGMDADWGAKYVSQSFPLATTPMVMKAGQSVKANMVLKNIGSKAWTTSTKLATTQPRDRASVFVGPDWLSPSRLAAVKGTVAPGAEFKFEFTFHAPDKPGTYLEYFGMVQEGVAWFSAPGQAGPADDVFEAQIQVIAADPPQSTTSVGAGGSASTGAGGSASDSVSVGVGVGGSDGAGGDSSAEVGSGPTGGDPPGAEGSCSLSPVTREPSPLPAAVGLAMLGLAMRRRRRD